MKSTRKAILVLILVIVVLVGGFIGYLALGEYRPEPILPVQISEQQDRIIGPNEELTITTFNLGYAALDRDANFFMDGGTMSRGLSLDRVESNLTQIMGFLANANSDIFILQEVDEPSTRSYGINEHQRIAGALKDYSSSFGVNYQVSWVPVPITKPMGKVRSGILTLSRLTVSEATRYTLPGEYSWPTHLAQLDRCLLESRIPTSNGKELVIAHIHLSAFDKGGFIRNQQLAFLETYAREDYAKGNYVIIGGDWNHLLAEHPEEKRARLSANWPFWLELLPKGFLSEFNWAFDETIPSNRTVDAAYDPKTTFTASIDGFLISPNIEILSVSGHDLGFEFSDHNPVTVKIRIPAEIPRDINDQENTGEEMELEAADA